MRILLFILLTVIMSPTQAQDATPAEPSAESLRRNTIKLDFTTRWLYRQAYVASFERVINPRRTWGVILGYQQLPEARALGPGVLVTRDTRASGFKVGGEYRFYLAKENKYPAPRGVYIGPYASFNNFHNERNIQVDYGGTPEYAVMTSQINVLNLGVQIGYQFVFNDRWTVDLSFMGPALSNYNAKITLDGTYSFDPNDITNEILKDLISRFPGLGDLLAGGSTSTNGKVDTWAFGYRYQILVGYRFGKKSK